MLMCVVFVPQQHTDDISDSSVFLPVYTVAETATAVRQFFYHLVLHLRCIL